VPDQKAGGTGHKHRVTDGRKRSSTRGWSRSPATRSEARDQVQPVGQVLRPVRGSDHQCFEVRDSCNHIGVDDGRTVDVADVYASGVRAQHGRPVTERRPSRRPQAQRNSRPEVPRKTRHRVERETTSTARRGQIVDCPRRHPA